MKMLLTYLMGVITPFLVFVLYSYGRDTLALYRTVRKYGGEDPRVLNAMGRVTHRVIQLLVNRGRK